MVLISAIVGRNSFGSSTVCAVKIPWIFDNFNYILQVRNLWQTQTKRSADQAQLLDFHGATSEVQICFYLGALELPKLAVNFTQ